MKPTPASGTAGIEALRDKLRDEKRQSQAGRRDAMVEQAVQAWRLTPRGMGHDAFFRLGAALQRAGLNEIEIRAKLYEEAAFGSSPSDRKGEIKGILRSLRKRGRF